MPIALIPALAILTTPMSMAPQLTAQEKSYVAQGSKKMVNGWLWVKIKGAPYARGFQYGYLTAKEYKEAVRVYKAMTYQSTGMSLEFFEQQAAQMHKPLIPKELLDELQGMADGYTKAGVPTTLDEMIGWNAYMEITGYWWPTATSKFQATAPNGPEAKSHCSGFIATGAATKDHKIVIGHESFTEFWNGQYMNVILDITPSDGCRMVMQTSPGWIASMTDFWVTGYGIVVVETTIVGFAGYDTTKTPEYVRARMASQYGKSIDDWVAKMDAKNNGGYANSWLIGDVKTNEIARYEQGLIYTSLEKKKSGTFFGCNAPFDARIRNLECTDVGYSDIRQQTGARRTRWPQVLGENSGKIDAEVGKKMLADTYDVWTRSINPSSRTICSHYDIDPQTSASDPNAIWNVPYWPAGSVDGKVTTADLAKKMSMWGIFGRADGVPFDAPAFLKKNPQWNWQQGYLVSRPHQPWTMFPGK